MLGRIILSLALMPMMAGKAAAAEPVLLHAAGSLRFALAAVAAAFEKAAAAKVQTKFGPSGTLKDEMRAVPTPKYSPPPTWRILKRSRR